MREIGSGLGEEKRRPRDLRQEGAVPRSTLYAHVAELCALGIVVKREFKGPPWQVYYVSGPNGAEFERLLRGWADLLDHLPGASWGAPLRFAEAWAAGVIPALLAGPLAMAQVIALCESRATGSQVERLVQQLRRDGFLFRDGQRYAPSAVTRLAIGELSASARFERRHMQPGAAPITVNDGADTLRAMLRFVSLPGYRDGVCEFVVRATAVDPGPRAAACWAAFDAGRVTACGVGNAPGPTATTWMHGTIDDWLTAVVDGRTARLQSAGERAFGKRIVGELHAQLYQRR